MDQPQDVAGTAADGFGAETSFADGFQNAFPVSHDRAPEAPLAAEDIGEQIMAIVKSVLTDYQGL